MADFAQENISQGCPGETRRDSPSLTAGALGVFATVWPFVSDLDPALPNLAVPPDDFTGNTVMKIG